YSKPAQFTDRNAGKIGYRFTYLKSRTEPHRANLDQDYAKIKEAALEDKINRKLSEWFEERRRTTYISISDDYRHCPELELWMKESIPANATKSTLLQHKANRKPGVLKMGTPGFLFIRFS